MTTTVTFSAHLLPEYTNDPDFMSRISDPEFGNIAVSTLWAMHKHVKDKNESVPASALGDVRVLKMIESIRRDSDIKKAVLEERLANQRTMYEQRITMLEDQVAINVSKTDEISSRPAAEPIKQEVISRCDVEKYKNIEWCKRPGAGC